MEAREEGGWFQCIQLLGERSLEKHRMVGGSGRCGIKIMHEWWWWGVSSPAVTMTQDNPALTLLFSFHSSSPFTHTHKHTHCIHPEDPSFHSIRHGRRGDGVGGGTDYTHARHSQHETFCWFLSAHTQTDSARSAGPRHGVVNGWEVGLGSLRGVAREQAGDKVVVRGETGQGRGFSLGIKRFFFSLCITLTLNI